MKDWEQQKRMVEYKKTIDGYNCNLVVYDRGTDIERIEMDVYGEDGETLMQVRYDLQEPVVYSPPINVYLSPEMPKQKVSDFLQVIDEVKKDSLS